MAKTHCEVHGNFAIFLRYEGLFPRKAHTPRKPGVLEMDKRRGSAAAGVSSSLPIVQWAVLRGEACSTDCLSFREIFMEVSSTVS